MDTASCNQQRVTSTSYQSNRSSLEHLTHSCHRLHKISTGMVDKWPCPSKDHFFKPDQSCIIITVITIGCCRCLAEMHISVPRDMVFRYMTLHFLLKILFVAMFCVLSLLMLFVLCAVYLNCFMSGTDTLLSAFLRVMSLCMLFVICQLVRRALFFFIFLSCYLMYDFNNKWFGTKNSRASFILHKKLKCDTETAPSNTKRHSYNSPKVGKGHVTRTYITTNVQCTFY